jgi:hypothetical protein
MAQKTLKMTDDRSTRMENGYKAINSVDINTRYEGLTKREYFAGLAMQGLLANESLTDLNTFPYESGTAKLSVVMADELLKALDK